MANKLTDEDRKELIFEYLEEYEHYLRIHENEVYEEGTGLVRTMRKRLTTSTRQFPSSAGYILLAIVI